MGQLRKLLSELLPANPFYARKLAGAGVDANVASVAEFCARAPFTTKREAVEDQVALPPYGTNLTYPLERYTRFSQTSGTTGTPLRWLDTTESWVWMVENWARVFRESGVGPADHIFFAFSFGPFLGFWTAFEAGVRLGAMCLPGGGMSSLARLRVMRDNTVTVLCCTPTYAIRLGEVARDEEIDLSRSRVRRIIVAGEPGAGIPSTRARIERLWPGAEVRDHHGMTEVGPVTYECPARRSVLHVLEDAYIAELIDPVSAEPLPAGSTGELVLTNLGRTGSPLLRYRTGDLVTQAAAPVCACGSAEMALEGGILGRTDDMVVVRGVNLFPSAFEEMLRRFDEVAEYRVEVSRSGPLPEARVCLEPMPGCKNPGALCDSVEDALRDAFNLRVPVSAVPTGTLPRFELKAKRWIEVDEGEHRA